MSTLFDQIRDRSAFLSPDGKYRYHLSRSIPGGDRRIATFIMLNASTADHEVDDPTIRQCMGFCRRWDCGELHVVNLFALRATDPREIRRASDPVGPDNQEWIMRVVTKSADPNPSVRGPIVCAWGVHGSYMGQDQTVLDWLSVIHKPMALGITKDGHPRHPLYVP